MVFDVIRLIIEGVSYWKNKISTGPLTKKEIKRIKNDISKLMEEGEKIYQDGQYLNARKIYIAALQLERILPSSSSESIDLIKKKIDNTESKINEKKLDQISLILEKGDNLKNEEKYEEALNEYERAFSFIDKMEIYDANSRARLFNNICLRQIEALIEEGAKLKSKKMLDNAISSFRKALNLTQKMYPSKEKQNIIKKIEENLDIYSNIITEKIEVGKLLREQNKFVESIKFFQVAIDLVKKKYVLLENSIINRVKEVNEIREINNLINQAKLEKFQVTEKPVGEIGLETEIEAKLKIPPELERLRVVQERVIPSSPEEKPKELEMVVSAPEELEVIQEEEELAVRDLEEIPIEEEVLQEEKAAVRPPEEQPEEIIPSEPQIIKCSFCGIQINEETNFCPQCGTIFTKE